MDPIDENLDIASLAKENVKKQEKVEKKPLSRGRSLAAWERHKLKLRDDYVLKQQISKTLNRIKPPPKTP